MGKKFAAEKNFIAFVIFRFFNYWIDVLIGDAGTVTSHHHGELWMPMPCLLSLRVVQSVRIELLSIAIEEVLNRRATRFVSADVNNYLHLALTLVVQLYSLLMNDWKIGVVAENIKVKTVYHRLLFWNGTSHADEIVVYKGL